MGRLLLLLKLIIYKLICSAGGLVTAVAPVVINGNGIWVGWPGMHMEDQNEQIPESDPNDRTPTSGLLSSKVRHNIITIIFLKNTPSSSSQSLKVN